MNYMINWFKLAIKCTYNPFSLFLFRLGFKKDILLKTKSLGNIYLKDSNRVVVIVSILNFQNYVLKNNINVNEITKLNFLDFIKLLSSDEEIVEFMGIKFFNSSELIILSEEFFGDGNSPFLTPLKDTIVVDIGGNIGDTALMFSKEGAEVYAFEPVPPIYDLAIKNIDLNPSLKSKIKFFNKAISDKKGKISIAYEGEGTSAGSSTFSKKGTIYEVDSITMTDIFSDYIKENDKILLLQMDCEGSEYDIVLNSDLSMFKEVLIEYHQKVTGINHKVLIDSLVEQGFIVDNIFEAPIEEINIDEIGIIRAVNKNLK